ncbi:MAG: hypothetical protein DYG99_08395 [Bacteroidetes bacterium CHB5]|nr:hypothetical protein [Bacteroidetes bacterium CHB5]
MRISTKIRCALVCHFSLH